MSRDELLKYIQDFLDVDNYSDASLNGLQLEGTRQCRKIATAVTASLEAIDAAVEAGADTLIVHHGIIWKGQMLPLCGNHKDRIKALFDANINLLAYHLPLDANMTLGNNRSLCNFIGLEKVDYIEPGNEHSIAMKGYLPSPKTVKDVACALSAATHARVSVLGCADENAPVCSVAVCSGSGSFLVDSSVAPDFDALVSGECNEQTYHIAKETGTPVFVVGHDASEQCGIENLGRHLAEKFSLEHIHFHFDVEKEVISYDCN